MEEERVDNNDKEERFNLSIPKKPIILIVVLAVAIAVGLSLFYYVVRSDSPRLNQLEPTTRFKCEN